MNYKLCALSILLASAALPALAVGQLADITVIDRNTGAALPVYTHRGEYWVAGTPGARYAISVLSAVAVHRQGRTCVAVNDSDVSKLADGKRGQRSAGQQY